MKDNDALVDAHLVGVPCLRTLTIGGFTGGNLEDLGGETHWATGLELVFTGTVGDVRSDTLDMLDRRGAESDSSLDDLSEFLLVSLLAHCGFTDAMFDEVVKFGVSAASSAGDHESQVSGSKIYHVWPM